MKAVICTKYGSPEVAKLQEVSKPIPKDSQILVKIVATAINSGDARVRSLDVKGFLKLAVVLASSLQVNAQDTKKDSIYRKWFIGSTFLMFGNLDKTNNPEYIQLNAGYRITPKDVVQFRFKRSTYAWPIGSGHCEDNPTNHL